MLRIIGSFGLPVKVTEDCFDAIENFFYFFFLNILVLEDSSVVILMFDIG